MSGSGPMMAWRTERSSGLAEIEAIDSVQGMENLISQLKVEMLLFNNVVSKIGPPR